MCENKTRSKVLYIIITSVLFLNFSFWLTSEMNTMIRYFLILGINGIVLLFRRRFVLSKNLLKSFLMIIGIQMVSAVFTGTYMGVTTGLYISTISAFLFVVAVDYDEFQEVFRYFVIVECICSLVVFFAYLVAPSIFDVFSTITTWRQGRIFFKNVYISVLPVSMGSYYRNFGIFVEPGIHATIISFAFIQELFHRKTNIKVVILYIMTVITTISTSGVISIVMIMIVYMLSTPQSETSSKLKNRILVAFLFGVIIFFFLYQSGYITTYIFDKLSVTDTISGHERRKGYEIVLTEFLNHPVLGMGLKKAIGTYYVEQNATMTATILNWFGVYGSIYGLLCCGGLWRYEMRNIRTSMTLKFLMVAVLFVITFSQDFSREFIIFVMVFYGYSGIKRESIEENYE